MLLLAQGTQKQVSLKVQGWGGLRTGGAAEPRHIPGAGAKVAMLHVLLPLQTLSAPGRGWLSPHSWPENWA